MTRKLPPGGDRREPRSAQQGSEPEASVSPEGREILDRLEAIAANSSHALLGELDPLDVLAANIQLACHAGRFVRSDVG
jgi:hypothetical protein